MSITYIFIIGGDPFFVPSFQHERYFIGLWLGKIKRRKLEADVILVVGERYGFILGEQAVFNISFIVDINGCYRHTRNCGRSSFNCLGVKPVKSFYTAKINGS